MAIPEDHLYDVRPRENVTVPYPYRHRLEDIARLSTMSPPERCHPSQQSRLFSALKSLEEGS